MNSEQGSKHAAKATLALPVTGLEGLSPGPDPHLPLSFWAAEPVGDKRLMLMKEHVKPEL